MAWREQAEAAREAPGSSKFNDREVHALLHGLAFAGRWAEVRGVLDAPLFGASAEERLRR